MIGRYLACSLACLGVALFIAEPVLASAQNLPWEGPLTKVQASLTGPVAVAISIIAIMIAGAALVWGGEISDFARRMVMIVLVVSVIAGSVTIFNTLFTAPGASIGVQAGMEVKLG